MRLILNGLEYNLCTFVLMNLYYISTIHASSNVTTSYDEYINHLKWNDMLISNQHIPINNLTCHCTENLCDKIGLSTCLTNTHGFCYKKIQYNHLTKKIECHQGCAPKEYNRLACNIHIPEYGHINFRAHCCNSHDLCNSFDQNYELYCSQSKENAFNNDTPYYYTFFFIYIILMSIAVISIIIFLFVQKIRKKYNQLNLNLKIPLNNENISLLSNEININEILENLSIINSDTMQIKWRGLEVIFKCFNIIPKVNHYYNKQIYTNTQSFKWKKQFNVFSNFRLTHNSILENYVFDYTEISSYKISKFLSDSNANYIGCFYSLMGCYDYPSLKDYFFSQQFKDHYEHEWMFDELNSSMSCSSSYSVDKDIEFHNKKMKNHKISSNTNSTAPQYFVLLESLLSSLIEGLWYLHTNISQCQNTKPSFAHGNLNLQTIKIRINCYSLPTCIISDFSWCAFETNSCICSSIKKVLDRQMVMLIDECLCHTFHTDDDINENKAFLSPEVLKRTITKDIKASTYISSWMQADIYSIGLIIWYIYDTIIEAFYLNSDENKLDDIYGNILKSSNKIQMSVNQILTMIESNIRPLNHLNQSIETFQKLYDLIIQCWNTNPSSRLNIYRIKIMLEDVFNCQKTI